MAGGNRVYVRSQTFTPLSYGLLSVANQPVDSDPHWKNGIIAQPEACASGAAILDSCVAATGVPLTKAPTVTGGIPDIGANVFTVFAEMDCGSPVGRPEGDTARRTMNALTNGEGRALERVVWNGVAQGGTVHPHLAHNVAVEQDGVLVQMAATTVTTGTAVDVVEALGLLEGALASCFGGQGVIHVPRAALAHLASQALVIVDGPRLRTIGDNLVAAYSSGNREGPTGSDPAAGQAWFYATGPVTLYRDDARGTSTERESFNRSENSFVYVAERTYAVMWECCHLAAQVSLGGVITGTQQAAN